MIVLKFLKEISFALFSILIDCHSVIYSCDAEMDFQHIYLSRAEMVPLVTRVTPIQTIIEANYVKKLR